MPTQNLVLATGNQGKVREIARLLSPLGIEVQPQTQLGVSSVAETGLTFVENALIKARHASDCTQMPALSDDSGLVVPALQGAPGIYSARYAGEHASDQDNYMKLLQEMEGMEGESRRAFFYCVLVWVRHPQDPCPWVFEGKWWGHILSSPQGDQGFGYDPVFAPHGQQGQSAAELPLDVKNQCSHRAQALKDFVDRLVASPQDIH